MNCSTSRWSISLVVDDTEWEEAISVYIPEFVCGIFATVIAEIAAMVAWYIYDSHKKKR